MNRAIAHFALPSIGESIGLVSVPVGESIDPIDLPPRPLPEKIVGEPMQLKPIAWGKRDSELARVVCRHVVEVTPPTVLPYNHLKDERMHHALRSLAIRPL